MRILTLLFVSMVPFEAFAGESATNWAQPPLLCIEDIIPGVPSRPCPDLSDLVNPLKDEPSLPEKELTWWKSQKFGLSYCRSKEVFRREKEDPGSQTAGAIELSWMRINAVNDRDLKVKTVYDASSANQVPPHILTGAFMQESIFAPLGVADDGGNFSCGVGQINMSEWCDWAETQSSSKKKSMNWPTDGVDCGAESSKTFAKPFYDIAVERLGSLPTYRMTAAHLQKIPLKSVSPAWSDVSSSVQKRRYELVTAFLNSCLKIEDAIPAKAYQLRKLYNYFVPQGLKQHEVYKSKEKYNKQCSRPHDSKVYPVQTGWLVAVGAYNAGAKVQDAMAYTRRWSKKDIESKETFKGFTPQGLVSSIYNVGKLNPKTGRVEFKDLNGDLTSWSPFKICILQRHIARVVQHVTEPGVAPLVDSLEGAAGCKKTIWGSYEY